MMYKLFLWNYLHLKENLEEIKEVILLLFDVF
jgi:hypothetical protein